MPNEQLEFPDLASACGRTSKEPTAPTEGKTSRASSRSSSASSAKTRPMFLYLREADGLTADALWVAEPTESLFPSLGDYTTRSFGASPSVVRECRLSQILEEQPHPKYLLSAKACKGILTRAERRGKELPTVLRLALERQSEPEASSPETAQTPTGSDLKKSERRS